MTRMPAVAGYFYPAQESKLHQEVAAFLASSKTPRPALGVVSPHAGYVYSGAVAGKVFAEVEIPKRVILLGPNHTGRGAWAALSPNHSWQTPLGEVQLNRELGEHLREIYPDLTEDAAAHQREHSLEVQVPFLQIKQSHLSLLPLCLSHFSYGECEALGEAIAQVIQEQQQRNQEPILLVASSDMNHYESQEETLEKDNLALEPLLNLDPAGLYQTVHENNISMCGIIPVTVMLVATRKLGATRATLIDHKTSGDVSGDYDAVVGYAGVVVE